MVCLDGDEEPVISFVQISFDCLCSHSTNAIQKYMNAYLLFSIPSQIVSWMSFKYGWRDWTVTVM